VQVNEDEDLDGRCKTRIPMLVCCALVGLIGLRMAYTELRSLLRTGVRRYLRSGWNLLDVTIIALLTTVGVYYTNLCMADEVWYDDTHKPRLCNPKMCLCQIFLYILIPESVSVCVGVCVHACV
jgi:hypothetical protein